VPVAGLSKSSAKEGRQEVSDEKRETKEMTFGDCSQRKVSTTGLRQKHVRPLTPYFTEVRQPKKIELRYEYFN
jgi:hypothetical protein